MCDVRLFRVCGAEYRGVCRKVQPKMLIISLGSGSISKTTLVAVIVPYDSFGELYVVQICDVAYTILKTLSAETPFADEGHLNTKAQSTLRIEKQAIWCSSCLSV